MSQFLIHTAGTCSQSGYFGANLIAEMSSDRNDNVCDVGCIALGDRLGDFFFAKENADVGE